MTERDRNDRACRQARPDPATVGADLTTPAALPNPTVPGSRCDAQEANAWRNLYCQVRIRETPSFGVRGPERSRLNSPALGPKTWGKARTLAPAQRGCKAPNINGFILRARPQRFDRRSHMRLCIARRVAA